MPSLRVVPVASGVSATEPSGAIAKALTEALATGPKYTAPEVDGEVLPPQADRKRASAALVAAVSWTGFTITLQKAGLGCCS
ncbi:hypothetical protein GCM10010985_49140 [Caballeronia grimmiae]|uniref:Uncharacterized protein n=1 Tax=Caballeronia grimmiae TaxID=1071679 RepID=A0ABQ1S2M4_9BURK|nr:hypothetical protein GCM10010985_49140 [Caballeronia grimmiae]